VCAHLRWLHGRALPRPLHRRLHCGFVPCTGNFNSGIKWNLLKDSNTYVFKGTLTGITPQDVTNLNENRYYFNVHNGNNPGGCATGVLWQVGQGPNSPTHSAVLDSVQSGFAPAGDGNFRASAFGVALYRRTAQDTYNGWLHHSGAGALLNNAHIHSGTLGNPSVWHPEDAGVTATLDFSGTNVAVGNTTNTGLSVPDAHMDGAAATTTRAYVNLHAPGTFYGGGVMRGFITPTLALPVGSPTTFLPSSSTGPSGSSTGNPASTVVASFFMVAILALVAVLFQ
jgi:hypothetical protein